MDSAGGPVRQIGLLYRPAQLHRLAAVSIPWNRILGSLNVYKFGLQLISAYLRTSSMYQFLVRTVSSSIEYVSPRAVQAIRNFFLDSKVIWMESSFVGYNCSLCLWIFNLEFKVCNPSYAKILITVHKIKHIHRKKGSEIPVPQRGCHLPNSLWAGKV